jgi:anti-sigma regulatory factor (Ser/Thr protein kinase)
MDDAALLSLQLPRRPEAASAARKALASLNGALHLIGEARLPDAQLLVSEIVTNAVRYSEHDTIALDVHATPATLRVEIANTGLGFDAGALAGPQPGNAGGWGLRIVDVIADRWGTAAGADTVRVWFEVDRPCAESPLEPSGEAPPPHQ